MFETHLASKYRFDNFVVGLSNRLAHAASLAVADILLRAIIRCSSMVAAWAKRTFCTLIGNAVLQQCCRCCMSLREFTNDLVNAIRTKTTAAFREKYRQVDVLLIDDIQFISGKESTQEEFFHTSTLCTGRTNKS